MAVSNRLDPFGAFRFRVEIDGIQRAGFHEVSGLDSGQAIIEYREGDEKTARVRKRFQLAKDRLRELAKQHGLLPDE